MTKAARRHCPRRKSWDALHVCGDGADCQRVALTQCRTPVYYDLLPGSLAESDSVIALAVRRANHAVTCV